MIKNVSEVSAFLLKNVVCIINTESVEAFYVFGRFLSK